jgi:uncharacterized protein YjiK
MMTGLAAFLGFGLCMSCLSVMEQRMGLVGKDNRLVHARPPISIPHIKENLSGVTWNPATGTLFTVTNSPQAIHELTPEGLYLRNIRLDGFSDTEDIAHMGDDLFALVEERRGFIRLVRISDSATSVHIEDSSGIDLGSRHEDNKGFESLFFDHSTRTLLTMRELPPYELVTVTLNAKNEPESIRRTPLSLDVDDVAALGRDASGSLWVLSEASSCLVRLDEKGRTRQRLSLRAGALPFEPEGLAFGKDGAVFIVGEPSTFVISSLVLR